MSKQAIYPTQYGPLKVEAVCNLTTQRSNEQRYLSVGSPYENGGVVPIVINRIGYKASMSFDETGTHVSYVYNRRMAGGGDPTSAASGVICATCKEIAVRFLREHPDAFRQAEIEALEYKAQNTQAEIEACQATLADIAARIAELKGEA